MQGNRAINRYLRTWVPAVACPGIRQSVRSNRSWNSPFVTIVARTWHGESIQYPPSAKSYDWGQKWHTQRLGVNESVQAYLLSIFLHVTEACIYILKEYRMYLSSEANSIYTFTSTNQYLSLLAKNPCIFIHTAPYRDAVVSDILKYTGPRLNT